MSESRETQFADYNTETLGFPSTWKGTRHFDSKPVQTDDIKTQHQEVQCDTGLEQAVQTDFEEVDPEINTMKPPYPPSLYAFFTKVTDDMCRALQENLDPFSAEVFKDFGDPDEFGRAERATKEFTLRSSSVSSEEFGASCVAWNKTGTQIAVSYSAHTHTTWCSHRVPISSWNLRRMFDAKENSAHVEIFLPSCITALDYHPLHPSVLAVGTFSGCLAILDFSLVSDNSNVNSNHSIHHGGGEQLNDLGYFKTRPEHGLPITNVHWIKLSSSQSRELITKNENTSQFCIITSGKEGHICLWSTNTSNTRVFLEKKFIVWADNIAADVPLSLSMRCVLKQLGIVGIGRCKDDPFTCVLATLGGFIFQVNLGSNIEAYAAMLELNSESSINEDKFVDPGLVYVSRHSDCPKVIHCSPFHRDVFLVGNSNGEVLIQNMLHTGTMFKYDLGKNARYKTLQDAKWSGRPTMFGVAMDKLVHIFDLRKGKNAIVIIPHEDVITNIAFNEIEIGTLAVCDTKNVIHIWNLPGKYSSLEPKELDILIKSTNDSNKQQDADEESENELEDHEDVVV